MSADAANQSRVRMLAQPCIKFRMGGTSLSRERRKGGLVEALAEKQKVGPAAVKLH